MSPYLYEMPPISSQTSQKPLNSKESRWAYSFLYWSIDIERWKGSPSLHKNALGHSKLHLSKQWVNCDVDGKHVGLRTNLGTAE